MFFSWNFFLHFSFSLVRAKQNSELLWRRRNFLFWLFKMERKNERKNYFRLGLFLLLDSDCKTKIVCVLRRKLLFFFFWFLSQLFILDWYKIAISFDCDLIYKPSRSVCSRSGPYMLASLSKRGPHSLRYSYSWISSSVPFRSRREERNNEDKCWNLMTSRKALELHLLKVNRKPTWLKWA